MTRDSEERFRLTFEQAAVGMAHLSVDGRWLDVNDRLCQLLGRAGIALTLYPLSAEHAVGQTGRDHESPGTYRIVRVVFFIGNSDQIL
jgi:PAS domain-containing protein